MSVSIGNPYYDWISFVRFTENADFRPISVFTGKSVSVKNTGFSVFIGVRSVIILVG